MGEIFMMASSSEALRFRSSETSFRVCVINTGSLACRVTGVVVKSRVLAGEIVSSIIDGFDEMSIEQLKIVLGLGQKKRKLYRLFRVKLSS